MSGASLFLNRVEYAADGVFGRLTLPGGDVLCTLEHSYTRGPGQPFLAKLQSGTYTCVRGTHELHDGAPFTTFEITGVTGHSGILFHVGNYNRDSEGCVLLGLSVMRAGSCRALASSKMAFDKFISEMGGFESFVLEVK